MYTCEAASLVRSVFVYCKCMCTSTCKVHVHLYKVTWQVLKCMCTCHGRCKCVFIILQDAARHLYCTWHSAHVCTCTNEIDSVYICNSSLVHIQSCILSLREHSQSLSWCSKPHSMCTCHGGYLWRRILATRDSNHASPWVGTHYVSSNSMWHGMIHVHVPMNKLILLENMWIFFALLYQLLSWDYCNISPDLLQSWTWYD